MKKVSLKSGLYAMKNFEINAGQVLGGAEPMGGQTTANSGSVDSYTSQSESGNTNWDSDVTDSPRVTTNDTAPKMVVPPTDPTGPVGPIDPGTPIGIG